MPIYPHLDNVLDRDYKDIQRTRSSSCRDQSYGAMRDGYDSRMSTLLLSHSEHTSTFVLFEMLSDNTSYILFHFNHLKPLVCRYIQKYIQKRKPVVGPKSLERIRDCSTENVKLGMRLFRK